MTASPHPVAAPDGRRLAFSFRGNLALLDLTSGASGRWGWREDGGRVPVWSPDGSHLVVVADVRDQPGLRRIVLRPDGVTAARSEAIRSLADTPPALCYAPGGEWLAFSQTHWVDGNIGHSDVLAMNTAGGKAQGEARRIAQFPGGVTAVSPFPDGKSLLVSHGCGWSAVNVDTGEPRVLFGGILTDPDAPDQQLHRPSGAVVDPTGTRLALGAWRWSGRRNDIAFHRLYTCNLDGSDVKRITPLEDDSVEPYVFPQTGKTAFDVARSISEQQKDQQEGE